MSKKLLIVRPTLAGGGADRVTLTLLCNLDRRRFEPTLVLMRAEGELLAELPSDVPLVDLHAGNLWSAAGPLRRVIEEQQPDVVFSTSSGTNITAARACRSGERRLVLSERNVLHRGDRSPKRRVLLEMKRRFYPRANCVTAVSEGVAGELVRRLGLDAERVVVVYNPVVTVGLDRRAAEPVDEPWLTPGQPPVVLAAGRLTRAKGFDLLIEAFATLVADRDCRLILLGEGPLRGDLERRVGRLGLSGRVKMPGFVANPHAYMSRSRLFVLTSRFEGLPGVLIQAMAAGCAAVATNCPFGPAEIIEDGKTGLLVPVEDSGALAGAVSSLLDAAELRRDLAAAGRVSVRERFSLDASLPRYEDALDPEGAA